MIRISPSGVGSAGVKKNRPQARTDDLVLIAGKGHEDYQIIGREVFHFDDKEVAREALASRAV